MQEKTVVAIDPGTTKCGLAVVRRNSGGKLEIVSRAILAPDELVETISSVKDKERISLLIVGGGTQSQRVVSLMREAMPSMGILVVDEKDTTLQARERYWEHHKRRGWRRLLPATLQVPPEPVDDFVAFILAERVLSQS
jgi:RNase H-fold protein (predicted Holliday junction resolvase)